MRKYKIKVYRTRGSDGKYRLSLKFLDVFSYKVKDGFLRIDNDDTTFINVNDIEQFEVFKCKTSL